MADTVISCISDEETFVHDVYDYLYKELERQKQDKESSGILLAPDLIRLDADNGEIHVNERSLVPRGMIKWVLESYLKSDPSRFKGYDVIEFGDAFTIGKVLHPSQMDMLSCEICGFFTPYSEEMHTHRMTHFGI